MRTTYDRKFYFSNYDRDLQPAAVAWIDGDTTEAIEKQLDWFEAAGNAIAHDLHEKIWSMDSAKLLPFASVLTHLALGYLTVALSAVQAIDPGDDEDKIDIKAWLLKALNEAVFGK